MPVDKTSFATADPIFSIKSVLLAAPKPILWGNMVAPITLLWPCTASVPHKIGMVFPLTIGDAL